MYFKHKQIAGASETFRQTHHIVHMLLGGDGHACRDASHQGDIAGSHDGSAGIRLAREWDDLRYFAGRNLVIVETHDFDGSALVRVHANEALVVKHLQLVFDG